ncbi:MAG: hypothetical protein AAFZ46_02045 [Pseudomonadota bacterium]
MAQALDQLFDMEQAKVEAFLASDFGQNLPEKRQDTLRKSTKHWFRRAQKVNAQLERQGAEIPGDLLRSFDIPYSELLDIQVKYRTRMLNIIREYARIKTFMPELMEPPARRVVSLSPGGCGCADVLTFFGHKVTHFDYLEYDTNIGINQKLHKALKLRVTHFNGNERPYKLRKSYYDYLSCYQAVNLYGTPEQSGEIIRELMLIPKVAGCFVLNPIQKYSEEENAVYEQKTIDDVSQDYDVTVTKCPETQMTAMIMRKP